MPSSFHQGTIPQWEIQGKKREWVDRVEGREWEGDQSVGGMERREDEEGTSETESTPGREGRIRC